MRVRLAGTAPPAKTFLPLPEHDREDPQRELVEEPLGEQRLHEVEAADDVHVRVTISQPAHLLGEVGPEQRRAVPIQRRVAP